MPDFEVHEPGMYVPIELAKKMAELLELAQCSDENCNGLITHNSQFEYYRCRWCDERTAAVANLK